MKKSNWHGGKGSTPRTNTSSQQYQDNWDKIFAKPKKKEKPEVDEKEIDKS